VEKKWGNKKHLLNVTKPLGVSTFCNLGFDFVLVLETQAENLANFTGYFQSPV